MATPFNVPHLGDGVDSGEVTAVLVNEGDTIAVDDPVVELETGKATVEVPSEVAGKIVGINVKAGDTVTPGQTLLSVESDDSAGTAETEGGKEAPEKQDDQGDQQQEPDADAETAAAGSAPEGEEKPATPQAPASSPSPAPASPSPAPESGSRVPVAAAPSVRKFARELGIPLSNVAGSGPSGRISVEDVKAYAKQQLSGAGAATAGAGGGVAAPPLPDFTQWGEVERQKLNNVRKATAQHMAMSWSLIPHVTQQEKADITDMESLRKRYAKQAEKAGGKLTLTAMLLKVVAAALKVYPQFNASADLAQGERVVKKYIHIGVAVDTEKGLMVPVVRDVDRKSIIQLAVELNGIAEKARSGKIAADDIRGGTFTLSNLGGIGGSYFTPIINYPEVAILGVGRGAYEPVFINEQFEPRLLLPLSLSYDHRMIDGADGARFIRWIADAIKEPLLMAM